MKHDDAADDDITVYRPVQRGNDSLGTASSNPSSHQAGDNPGTGAQHLPLLPPLLPHGSCWSLPAAHQPTVSPVCDTAVPGQPTSSTTLKQSMGCRQLSFTSRNLCHIECSFVLGRLQIQILDVCLNESMYLCCMRFALTDSTRPL